MYRKAKGFSVLILYLATLLNMSIMSKSFLVANLDSSKYKTIWLTNRDNLGSSFPICISYVFLLTYCCI